MRSRLLFLLSFFNIIISLTGNAAGRVAPPGGLTATTLSPTRIDLRWANDRFEEAGYTIESSRNGSDGWARIGTVDADFSYFQHTGLTPGTTYYYRVRATKDTVAYSNVASATTPLSLPAAPTNLQATAVGSDRIDLTWTDNATDETGYILQNRDVSGSDVWHPTVDLPANSTSFSFTRVSANTELFFRVVAVNGAVLSNPSNVASARTGRVAPPSNVVATVVSARQVVVTWQDNTPNESGFQVYRSENTTSAFSWQAAVPANATRYEDNFVWPERRYYYKIIAVATSNSEDSNVAEAITPRLLPPAAPSDLTAKGNAPDAPPSITLTFRDNADDERDFLIDRAEGDGEFRSLNGMGASPGAGSVLTFVDTQVEVRRVYRYRVWARKENADDSGFSNVASAAATGPPAAPANVATSDVTTSSVTITWLDNADDETGFELERRTPNEFVKIADLPASTGAGNTARYVDNAVEADKFYGYRVRAVRAESSRTFYSTYSGEALTQTPLDPAKTAPDPVTNVVAHADGPDQITLTWTNPTSSFNDLGIYLSPNGKDSWQIIEGLSASSPTTFRHRGLTAGTTYYYAIQTRRVRGDLSWTSPFAYANATTAPPPAGPPTAPANVETTVVSSRQIDLRWQDNSADETGFELQRSSDGGATFPTQFNLSANTTTYSDNGLAPGTTYQYRLRAVKGGATPSGFAASAVTTTLGIGPAAPSTLEIGINRSGMALRWRDNADDETGYELQRSDPGTPFFTIATLPTNVTSHIDNSPFIGNERYVYRVRALKAGADPSTFSAEVAVQSLPTTPPAAPSGLNASFNTNVNAVVLQWTSNSENDDDGFWIERSADGVNGWSMIKSSASSGFRDGNVDFNRTYYYRVQAVKWVNQQTLSSAYSNVASITTPAPPPAPLPPPLAAERFAATAVGQTQINLSWALPANGNFTGLDLQWSPTTYELWTPIDIPASATTFEHRNLTPGTTYQYRLQTYRTENDQRLYSARQTAQATTEASPPASPSDLTSADATATSVTLRWQDNANDETGFDIERSPDASPRTWTKRVDVGVNSPPPPSIARYTDGGLAPNTGYIYRVRAMKVGPQGTLSSGYSNELRITTTAPPPASPPADPSGLVASAVNSSQIDLTWQDNSADETGFELEITQGSNVATVTLGTNTTRYSHNGLPVNTTYAYRVRATKTEAPPSGWTGTVTATTPAPPAPQPPADPGRLQASASSPTTIALDWQDNSGDETGFELWRGPRPDALTLLISLGANVTRYTDNALTPQTTYYYQVRAIKFDAPMSGFTSQVQVATPPAPPNAPSAPSGLIAAAISATRIEVRFTDGSDNETGFSLERATSGEPFAPIATLPGANGAASTVTYQDDNLSAATTYRYRLRAVRTENNLSSLSSYTNEASAQTLPLPPAGPGNLTTQPTSATAVTLTWTDNATNETGFDLERATSNGTFAKIADVAANATMFTDNGVVPLTTYQYRLRAVNAGGASPYSGTANVTTPDAPPVAPSNLLVTATGHDRVTLTWTDNATNETGYAIDRSTDGATFRRLAEVGVNVTTFSDSGLAAATRYNYRVMALNAVGSSAISGAVAVQTLIITSVLQEPARQVWAADRQLFIWLGGSTTVNAQVTLVSAGGQVVRQFSAAIDNFSPTRHALDGLAGGVYIAIVKTRTQHIVQKIWLP